MSLFIAWDGNPWAGPVAVGLVTGAVLSQIDQILSTTGFFLSSQTSGAPGPGWWLSVVGTAVLVGCLVLVREAVMDGRPRLRRDWRAAVAAVVVVAALVAWLQAFADFYVWFAGVASGLLLAAVCLPVVGSSLTRAQRLAALAAVTVLGAWLVAFAVHAYAVQTFLHDERSTGVALICTVASVAACFLAQVRPPRPRPAAEAAPRR